MDIFKCFFLTIFLDNTLLNLDKNNGFISFFLAKTLRLDNHGYILIFINLGKTITKDGRKIMTENQYIRANSFIYSYHSIWLYCADPDGSIRSG